MILYHGTNTIVRHPEVRISGYNKDFGFGFYTTTNRDQAVSFAEKRIKELTAHIYLFGFGFVQIISAFVFRADTIVAVNTSIAGA